MNATETLRALALPFDSADVHWKPQRVNGNRALAVAYIDARAVMDRLDEVCGLGWSDEYEVLPNGSVICRLSINVDGHTIVRTDVGSQSEQQDEGDKLKAAFSDALKRAAVKLGIGRYLYRLPKQWVDFDAQRKAIKEQPQLPDWAKPQPRPGETITHDQAKELHRLLQANRGIDPARFLEHFNAARLSEIHAEQMTEALNMLQAPPSELLRKVA